MKKFLPNDDLINEVKQIKFYSTISKKDLVSHKIFTYKQIRKCEDYLLKMWSKHNVNFTESLQALHFSCRHAFFKSSSFFDSLIFCEINDMFLFADNIRNGKFGDVKNIIHLGTGGSNFGPQLIYDCFKNLTTGPKMHFVSNIDPSPLSILTKNLDPMSTLIFVVSKSFTTVETLSNLKRVKSWFSKTLPSEVYMSKIVAITSNYKNALSNKILPENIVRFNKSIGGRFSIWSAANLAIPTIFGTEFFKNFLKGGKSIDDHVSLDICNSLPFSLAERSYYSRLIKREFSHCIVPYLDALKLLPIYLQQLIMESNGKSFDQNLNKINSPTSNVFGYQGTDAQHTFFQSLHQSTLNTSIDLICFNKIQDNFSFINKELDLHAFKVLFVNCLAQYYSFKNGNVDHLNSMNDFKLVEGNKCVNLLLLEKLSPFSLGQIICLYEYKTIIEAALSNVNPFDQYGVELGKNISNKLLN